MYIAYTAVSVRDINITISDRITVCFLTRISWELHIIKHRLAACVEVENVICCTRTLKVLLSVSSQIFKTVEKVMFYLTS